MKFSEEEKAMRLEDWRQSGKSAWAYAKANGLNAQTFVKWTKTEAESKPRFVEVPVPAMPGAQREPEILIEKREVKIHIPLISGSRELRAVIEWLGRAI
jgi:transposase-like protein